MYILFQFLIITLHIFFVNITDELFFTVMLIKITVELIFYI